MSLALIHRNIGSAGVLFLTITAVWSLVVYFRKGKIDGNLWGILIIAELLFIAQGVLGIVLYAEGGRPARLIHYLYGFLMVILIPSAFAFTKGEDGRREALVYGLLTLFMAIMAYTRAMTTG